MMVYPFCKRTIFAFADNEGSTNRITTVEARWRLLTVYLLYSLSSLSWRWRSIHIIQRTSQWRSVIELQWQVAKSCAALNVQSLNETVDGYCCCNNGGRETICCHLCMMRRQEQRDVSKIASGMKNDLLVLPRIDNLKVTISIHSLRKVVIMQTKTFTRPGPERRDDFAYCLQPTPQWFNGILVIIPAPCSNMIEILCWLLNSFVTAFAAYWKHTKYGNYWWRRC